MSQGELTYMARVLARIEIDDPALYRRIIGSHPKRRSVFEDLSGQPVTDKPSLVPDGRIHTAGRMIQSGKYMC